MTQLLAIPRVISNDWKRLDLIVNKIKFHLGSASSPTFAGVTITGLTASALIGTNASKALESVTIGTSLNYTRPTLNTIQDIRTSASPTFAGLHINSAEVDSTTLLTLESDINNNNEYNEILFKVVGGQNYGAIRSCVGVTGGDSYMSFFTTTDGGTLVRQVTIQHNGKVGLGTYNPETLLTIVSAAPYLTLYNITEEDTDGGRESRLSFKGEQSGGEGTTLARIEVGHDGTGDDEKGKIVFSVNDGDDGDTPTQALEIGSDLLATFAGAVSITGAVSAGSFTGLVIGTDVQAWDAGLDSLAGLTYAAASFVKMTGADTFVLRTLQETSDDLEATIDHDNLLNFAANEHYLQSAITAVGTIGTGVWQGTSIAVGYTDAKCVAVWPDTYTADQNLLIASSPTFAALTVTTINGLGVKYTVTGNIAIGDATTLDALDANPLHNIAIGNGAGSGITDGDNNIFIGYRAGYEKTTHMDNVAIGYEAWYKGTGNYSVVIGYQAGRYHSAGNNNTVIGHQAGLGVVTGATYVYNTIIGSGSGVNLTSGSYSVLLGYYSGNALTSGASNIFIGHNSGRKQTTLSNLFIVDNLERTDVATELTNAILYGVMAAVPANQTLRINAGITTLGGNLVIPDGGTIGQAAGPLLTFNDTSDRLELTGAKFRAGSGILFGVDSAAANTLSDYEEGTWTAELRGSTARADTPIEVTGYYTKIGRQVTCIAYFTNVDTTGATGLMQVVGFPYSSLNQPTNRGAGVVATYGLSIPGLYIVGDLPPNSTTMSFFSPQDDAAWIAVTMTAGAAKYMLLTIIYFVA